MAKFLGRRASVGIGKESSRGTAVAATYWVPWRELDFQDQYEVIMNDSARGIIEAHDGAALVKEWGEGSVSAKVKDDHVGLLFLSLMGSVSSATAGGETIVYDHTFSVQQSAQHQSLTISLKDDVRDVRFANAVVSSLELTAELGEYVMYTAEFLSKKSASATNTVAQGSETDFVPQNLAVVTASNKAGLGAGTSVTLKNLQLTISSNAETDDVLGSTDPSDVLNKEFMVEGSFEMNYEDNTFKDYVSAETDRAIRISLTGTETIGVGSNPTIQIDLAKCRFISWEPSIGLNDIATQTVEFQALYDTTEAEMIELVLTNAVASY